MHLFLFTCSDLIFFFLPIRLLFFLFYLFGSDFFLFFFFLPFRTGFFSFYLFGPGFFFFTFSDQVFFFLPFRIRFFFLFFLFTYLDQLSIFLPFRIIRTTDKARIFHLTAPPSTIQKKNSNSRSKIVSYILSRKFTWG